MKEITFVATRQRFGGKGGMSKAWGGADAALLLFVVLLAGEGVARLNSTYAKRKKNAYNIYILQMHIYNNSTKFYQIIPKSRNIRIRYISQTMYTYLYNIYTMC